MEIKDHADLKSKDLTIRQFVETDMKRLWEISAKNSHYAWVDYNAPYFNEFKQLSFAEFIELESQFYLGKDRIQGIFYKNRVIGMLSYYWESKATRWVEVGIVLYDEDHWSKGLGTLLMRIWISNVFDTFELNRVGFTTWSGNGGMIRLGEKLGMSLEKKVRSARYYKGVYYDSIGYGVLRDEWQALQNKEVSLEWINDDSLKPKITETILKGLYPWFGIEESTQEYVDDAMKFEMLVAKENDQVVGFISVADISVDTLEIHVMGIQEDHHRKGIGKQLVLEIFKKARLMNKSFVMVRTLDESDPNEDYDKTRKFYQKMGFGKLVVDPLVWGKNTPCLIMVKAL